MDKYHENKKTGYTGLDQFFIERKPTAPVIPALTRKVGAFHALNVSIEAKNGELIKAIKEGKTEKKANEEDAMLNLLFRVNANLRSVASEGSDEGLKKLTGISDSDLAGMRDTQLKDYANQIWSAATDNAAALVEYGVDDAMLAQLKTLIDAYGSMIGTSEDSTPKTSTIRKSLYALFPKTDAALKDLDDTMRGYETSDPDFYNEYFLLRPVKALGIRHKAKPINTPQAAPAK